MERDDSRELSSSFGTAAAAYAEHRPDYASSAVQWALAPAPGPRVLDLGAGTGKLTDTLLTLGIEVVAVEPDLAMLAELRRALPAARALPGSAEAIPLPDASVDAVVAGNAMHWFDMDVAGPEIARVLTPRGVLAGLWNLMDDRVDWVAGLARVGGPAAIGPRDTPAEWQGQVATMHLPTRGAVAVSDRRSEPSSRTRSGGPSTRSSRPCRRRPGSSSWLRQNARRDSIRYAHSSRADRRRPTATSPSR